MVPPQPLLVLLQKVKYSLLEPNYYESEELR